MLVKTKAEQIQLDNQGQLLWQSKVGSPLPGVPVARLEKGENRLKPVLSLLECAETAGQDRDQIQSFLSSWLDNHIETILAPLKKLEDTESFTAPVRGICFQLFEASGILPREKIEDLIAELTPEDRTALRSVRVKLGPVLVFLWELNKPAAVRLRALLWGIWNDQNRADQIPADGSVSVKIEVDKIHRGFYQSIGYPVYGPRAIRIDMLDRVISAVYDVAEQGKFRAQHKMAEWLGCSIDDLYAVLEAMGHKKIQEKAVETPDAGSVDAELQDVLEGAQNDAEVKAEATEAEVAITEESVSGEKSENDQENLKTPEKPELSMFYLKKGKANTTKKPFKGGKKTQTSFAGSKDKNKGKKERRGNPKGKEYKQSKMVASAQANPEDNPFAVLQQLKGGSDKS